jgi:beta-lactam-binding protein with PASTA domain
MDGAKAAVATFEQTTVCVVPYVIGKDLPTAKRQIVAHHCRVGEITRARSARVKKGRVISERPAAHTRLGRGARVNLTVSAGKA